MRHFLEIDDLTVDELTAVLDLAERPDPPQVLAGKGMGIVFEKPSARTRHSMEMAIVHLGGHPAYIQDSEVGLDRRESVEDVTRTLACYYHAVGARVFDHQTVDRMAAVDVVPVVNLLSDRAHPMQALADLLTMRQGLGGLRGRSVAYVGDANNVCRSLAIGAAMCGMEVRVASPAGYGLLAEDVDRISFWGSEPIRTNDPDEAVKGADVIYTDVWVSMGQEAEATTRRDAFEGYQVTGRLLSLAAPGAIFLHCLPAHRGEEVAAEVIDGPSSRVWPQAANRMHAARGLLAFLLGEGA